MLVSSKSYEDYAGDTYRAVYTVRISKRGLTCSIAFKRNRKKGNETPTAQMSKLIERKTRNRPQRLEEAELRRGEVNSMSEDIIRIERAVENVFADIGVRDPEDSLVRAKLSLIRNRRDSFKRRGLRQG